MESSETTDDIADLDAATNKTENNFQAPDGSIWVDVTNHSQVVTGRVPSHYVLTSRSGPTTYAKRKLSKEVSYKLSYCSLMT